MIRKGTRVKWKWGQGEAQGKVVETHTDIVGMIIDGNQVTRKGERGNKALIIEQDDGQQVLKLESEVERVDTRETADAE